jgi:hypothetical protein
LQHANGEALNEKRVEKVASLCKMYNNAHRRRWNRLLLLDIENEIDQECGRLITRGMARSDVLKALRSMSKMTPPC